MRESIDTHGELFHRPPSALDPTLPGDGHTTDNPVR